MIYRILKNPSDYTESTKYLSWERYFTHVLEEHTKGTELEYHKKKLNKQYLYAKAMKILSKFLLNSNICSCYTCKCGDAVCTAVFGKDGYSGAKLKII